MTKLFYFGFIALFIFTTKSNESSNYKRVKKVPVKVIELKKTRCYGSCPVYTLTIYKNKTAHLVGEKYMDLIGDYKAKVPDNIFEQLMEKFKKSNFFKFRDKYLKRGITDLPTTYLTFSYEKQTKTIQDYYGTPKAIKDLEKEVENLLKILEWQKKK